MYKIKPEQQKWVFWQMQKLRVPISKMKSHKSQFYSFQLFVNFSTDSDSSAIKFFRTGSKYAYIFIQKF